MNSSNQSEAKFHFDPVEGYYGDPGLLTIVIGFFIVIETIGNGLLVAVMQYEKFGMDPLKRTVINQLISQLCLLYLMGNALSMPLLMIRFSYGPLGKQILQFFEAKS